jgi:Family of unknown function (DUF6188)
MLFRETKDGWYCGLPNGRVQMIQIDFRLNLLVSDNLGEAWIHIETIGRLKSAREEIAFVPKETSSLAPVLCLFDARVDGINILKSGQISVDFADGQSLVVDPDASYEAWQVECSRHDEERVMLVCNPGGKVTLFRTPAVSEASV